MEHSGFAAESVRAGKHLVRGELPFLREERLKECQRGRRGFHVCRTFLGSEERRHGKVGSLASVVSPTRSRNAS